MCVCACVCVHVYVCVCKCVWVCVCKCVWVCVCVDVVAKNAHFTTATRLDVVCSAASPTDRVADIDLCNIAFLLDLLDPALCKHRIFAT